jgi:hypothetical protein
MARSRESLTVDTIYKERKSGLFFVTPDGVGCFWYDTLEEARGEHGDTGPLITIDELED